MNGLLLQTPEDSGSFPWPCSQCQNCQHRKECPYVYDQVISNGARLGRAEAVRIKANAEQLIQTISGTNDLRDLLESTRDLEQALSHGLSSELALIDSLCVQSAKYCQ